MFFYIADRCHTYGKADFVRSLFFSTSHIRMPEKLIHRFQQRRAREELVDGAKIATLADSRLNPSLVDLCEDCSVQFPVCVGTATKPFQSLIATLTREGGNCNRAGSHYISCFGYMCGANQRWATLEVIATVACIAYAFHGI